MNSPLPDFSAFLAKGNALDGLFFSSPETECKQVMNGDFAALIGGLGAIEVKGPDAVKFLQGQTTADFRLLSDTHSIPGCYLNLKGRVLASFRAMAEGESVLLVMPRNMTSLFTGWLAKFIVFSKATMRDVSSEWTFIGIRGERAIAALGGISSPAELNQAQAGNGKRYVSLGQGRQLVAVPTEEAVSLWQGLPADLPRVGDAAWAVLDIRSGMASITPATSDLFLPQMLHFQLFEGLNFNKGCYTGQEVVARAWFRGKIKQHMRCFSANCNEAPMAGSPIQAVGSEGTAHIGEVVMSAPAPDGCVLLAVVREDYLEHTTLALENGAALREESLPYAIPIGNHEGA